MNNMTPTAEYSTQVSRFYIDTRPLVPTNPRGQCELPLLETLRDEDQTLILRFIRAPDRLMSFASALLKYIFIHRTARIPWNEVKICRTPHPHRRPYWATPPDWPGSGGLEFNVTHQAGIVALLGCKSPSAHETQDPVPVITDPAAGGVTTVDSPVYSNQHVRLGVDIACTNEDKRTPTDLTDEVKLGQWIDVFSEMFSDEQRAHMKNDPVIAPADEGSSTNTRLHTNTEIIQQKLRRFYAYWALKEAYIKLVGEGLLANWLRQLEFFNVSVPLPLPASNLVKTSMNSEDLKWTPRPEVERRMTVSLNGESIKEVQMSLEAYEEAFLLATAMRGIHEVPAEGDTSTTGQWLKLDIGKDIQPCALGLCDCLDQPLGFFD